MADPFANMVPQVGDAGRWLVALGNRYGLVPVVTSTTRSPHQQAQLYQRLRGQQVCPPGTSAHERGLAFDCVVAAGKDSYEQAWLGAVWRYIGGAWDPADPVHFTVGKVGCG